MQEARQIGTIIGIIGGVHGNNNFSMIKDIYFICPCHCNAHKKEIYKKKFQINPVVVG